MSQVSASQFSLAASGNRDAIESVLASLVSRVRFVCAGRISARVATQIDGDDASQIAMIRLFEALASGAWVGRTEEEFLAYAYKQARNVSRRAVYKATRKGRDVRRSCGLVASDGSSFDLEAEGDSPVETASNRETIEILKSQLTRECDFAILSGIEAGASTDELAELAGITVPQVHYRLKYFRKVAARLVASGAV